MTQAPAATAMTDEQVRDVYHLLDSKLVDPEYGEFFADLVAVTGRPWREVAAIIGASDVELAQGGVNLAECE